MRQTPTIEIFNEIKASAISVWETYDNTYGYVTEKLEYINRLENIQDNVMVFYRMFDWVNQGKMLNMLSEESIEYIKENL
jgi:hypothetical protein